jgi:hypothetical protein
MAATVLLYGARIFRYQGYAWADQVCLTTPALCEDPHWVAVAAAAVAICYFYRQSLNS